MAMVGAIILARRDYLPDEIAGQSLKQPVLTLAERPRELVSVSGDGSSSDVKK